jgi:hypothetical protein
MSLAILSEKFAHRTFVGRTSELKGLERAFASSSRGPLLISGLHGIGKTSIAYELLKRSGLLRQGKVAYVDFRTLDGDDDETILANAGASVLSSVGVVGESGSLFSALQHLTSEHAVVLDELEVLGSEGGEQDFLPLLGRLWRSAITQPLWPKVIVITRHNWSEAEAVGYHASRRLTTSNVTIGALNWEDASELLQDRLSSVKGNPSDLTPYVAMAGGHPWLIDLIAERLHDVRTLPDVSDVWDDVYEKAHSSFVGIWSSLTPEQRILLASRASPEAEIDEKEARDMQVRNLRQEGLVGPDLLSLFSPLFAYWLVANRKLLFPGEIEMEASGTTFSVSTVKTVIDTLGSAASLLHNASAWFK